MATAEVRTLGQFLESDQVIDCDCSNYWVCSHSGPLRIELAVQVLGYGFDFYEQRAELAAHVYCSVCGKFHPTFRLGWKTRPAAYTGTHGAGAVVRTVLARPERGREWAEPADWKIGGANVRRFGPRR